MAAAALAAAADQKDMGWLKTGKIAKKPKLTDPLQLYSLCEVLSSEGIGDDAILTVKVVEKYYDDPVNFLPQGGGVEQGEMVKVARKDLQAANPPTQDMCQDLGDLDNLHEAGLLHCMGMRYCGGDKKGMGVKALYSTFIGPICVAVNPFSPGGGVWKNSFVFDDYVKSKEPVMTNKKLEPHPWAVGDMAYRELLEEGNNQAVLICGESGAGKTECCKFVLAFLIAKKESTVERLDEKLMDTNDPLEAFGNAKTVNNDNSSRFAKCMQICLDHEGRVIGAEIQTSLLEKARSCAFFQQERNFHIFYMLCHYRHEKCSADPGETQDTDTSDAEDMLGAKAYGYLKQSKDYNFIRPGAVEIDTEGQLYSERFRASDIDWFKRVIKSFRVSLGYTKEDTDNMMSLLTGIMHMGEIDFTDEDAAQVSESSKRDLEIAADCFGLDAAKFTTELVLERLMMGGSLISKELNKIKAMSSRDAICKSVFQTIFTDIVQRCNVSVAGDRDKAKGKVGVLDIFGFERMQFNSLEQICINYTNEKLHQTFINEVFESEKRVYRDEGLDPGAINFTDNAKVLEMVTGCNPHDTSGKSGATAAEIKAKIKVSLFGILDDVCKQEKNNGVTYCERVMKQWNGATDANGPLFEGPKFGAEEFSVVHFAGPVKYGTTEVDKGKFLPPSQWEKAGIDPTCPQIDSFLTKNKDKVPQSLLDFFAEGASNEYYQYITRSDRDGTVAGADAGSTTGLGGGQVAKTIVSKFNIEIEAFFKQLLTGANPKFIRAINPRPKGIPAPKTMGQRFNLQRVLGQLRYTGILDTVRVRASGYIIRKRYEDFAPLYIHPCNLLPEGNALQGDVDDLTFADSLRTNQEKAKEVIRALFANPEFEIDREQEILEGKTMIFIKKLSTIAKMTKRKEDMMAEVIKREKAKMNIVALALKCAYRTQARYCLPGATQISVEMQISMTTKLQQAWGRYLSSKMFLAAAAQCRMIQAELKRRHDIEAAMLAKVQDESGWPILDTPDGERWLKTEMGQDYLRSDVGIAWAADKEEKRKAAEAKAKAEAEAAAAKAKAEAEAEAARLKAMARQLAFAEAWGNGRLARVKYSIVKAEAIAEAKAEGRNWADGGGGLLKKRKKKENKDTSAGDVMKGYASSGAPEMLGADGTPVDEEKVSNALVRGATRAAEAAPRTSDPAKLKLTTRKFIKADLQVRTALPPRFA